MTDMQKQALIKAGTEALNRMAAAFPPTPPQAPEPGDPAIQALTAHILGLADTMGVAGLLDAFSQAMDQICDAREAAEELIPSDFATHYLSDVRWTATELARIKEAAEHLTAQEAKDTLPSTEPEPKDGYTYDDEDGAAEALAARQDAAIEADEEMNGTGLARE